MTEENVTNKNRPLKSINRKNRKKVKIFNGFPVTNAPWYYRSFIGHSRVTATNPLRICYEPYEFDEEKIRRVTSIRLFHKIFCLKVTYVIFIPKYIKLYTFKILFPFYFINFVRSIKKYAGK